MEEAVVTLAEKISSVILEPIIWLLVAASIIMFFYGFVMYFVNVASTSKKEEGRKHMLFGVIGLFIIFSVWGIINMIIATIDSVV
ncbi:MAG: hypothetical protein KAI16_02620 [Candidatus Pacebacteria bacterium]|nr:hypothetical protein [Candidatus Paceibacterota bacterium]